MESEGIVGEDNEETTTVEVDQGSLVVLDSDLDDFGSLEPELALVHWGDFGGQVDQLVQIEEPLDEVEELVLNRIPPLYNGQEAHRLVLIEDSPPYEDAPRYLSVEL